MRTRTRKILITASLSLALPSQAPAQDDTLTVSMSGGYFPFTFVR